MVAFEIFGLKIYWYGLFYLISLVFGYVFLLFLSPKISNKKLGSFITKNIDDIILVLFLGILIGGRLGFVLFYDLQYFLAKPFEIFYIWNGGMSFVGGTIGVILGTYLYLKKKGYDNQDFLYFMDMIVSFVPFGIMLGRLGNYLNQELYGRPVSEIFTGLSPQQVELFKNINFFHVYPFVDELLRINTNLFEGFFEGFFIFAILQFVLWKYYKFGLMKKGSIGGIFLVLYAGFRFIAEFLRDYTAVEYIWIFTKTQYMMIVFLILGIYLLRKRN